MKELLYFNTDFDFSLSATPELQARVKEVSNRKELLFWALGDGERHYICHSTPPNEQYAHQIARYGLLPLRPALAIGENFPDFQPLPWGWNNDAIKQFSCFGLEAVSPPLEAVKEANSRLFAFDIAQKNNLLLPGSCIIQSFAELIARLQELPMPVVVKPIFGNAGIGLSFIESWPLDANQEALLKNGLEQGGGAAIVEPWVKRVDDFSIYYQLTPDGQITNYGIQRCLVGRSGSFYGMIIEPDQPIKEASLLKSVAQVVATELTNLAYHGPVVIDGFTYLDPKGRLQINPLVEINARQTMGIIARHLLQFWDNSGAVMFRLARRKRCNLPNNIKELDNLLGGYHYQAGAPRGIAVLTPLADALPRANVLQNLFAVAGQDSRECLDQLAILESLVLKTKETVEITQQFSLL